MQFLFMSTQFLATVQPGFTLDIWLNRLCLELTFMSSNILSNNFFFFFLNTLKCNFNKHTIKTYNTINIVQVSSYKNFVQFKFLVPFHKLDIFM